MNYYQCMNKLIISSTSVSRVATATDNQKLFLMSWRQIDLRWLVRLRVKNLPPQFLRPLAVLSTVEKWHCMRLGGGKPVVCLFHAESVTRSCGGTGRSFLFFPTIEVVNEPFVKVDIRQFLAWCTSLRSGIWRVTRKYQGSGSVPCPTCSPNVLKNSKVFTTAPKFLFSQTPYVVYHWGRVDASVSLLW